MEVIKICTQTDLRIQAESYIEIMNEESTLFAEVLDKNTILVTATDKGSMKYAISYANEHFREEEILFITVK